MDLQESYPSQLEILRVLFDAKGKDRVANKLGRLNHRHSSLTARIWLTSTKEEHNGRQRRQKEQREGPETEGNQTGKRAKREEGQTTQSTLKWGAGFKWFQVITGWPWIRRKGCTGTLGGVNKGFSKIWGRSLTRDNRNWKGRESNLSFGLLRKERLVHISTSTFFATC